MSPLDKKDRRSIINVGRQLREPARRGNNAIFQKFLEVYSIRFGHMVTFHGVPYPYSITDANDAEQSSYRNEQYFLSRKQNRRGVLYLRELAASNPSGTWTVRYNYCTSHNSLKRYSCLWTLAINGVAVSPTSLRLAAVETECEKARET